MGKAKRLSVFGEGLQASVASAFGVKLAPAQVKAMESEREGYLGAIAAIRSTLTLDEQPTALTRILAEGAEQRS